MELRSLSNRLLSIVVLLCFTGCLAAPGRPSPEFLANRETKIRQLLTRGVEELQSPEDAAVERAGRLFELARELAAKDPRVLDGLGCYYFRKGEFDLATFYFQRALEVEPNYDRAMAHLALIARQNGHVEAARELLEQAIFMNPLNYQQRNNLVALGLEFGEQGGFDSLLTERELVRAQQSAPLKQPIIEHNLRIVNPLLLRIQTK